MITSVEDLVTSDGLNRGQGNALISKLDAAVKNLNAGNTKETMNKLNAFINQIKLILKVEYLQKMKDRH